VAALYAAAETAGPRYRELAELYAGRFLEGAPYPARYVRKEELFLPAAAS
jgi:hypothetical protein